jgi:4-hydroxybenzoate polyprenyltransferase
MAAYNEWVFQSRTLSIVSENQHGKHQSFSERTLSFLTLNAILVSFTTTGILFVSCLLQDTFNVHLLFACFFLTTSTYNLNRVTDLDEDVINAPERANYVKKNRKRILLTVVGSSCAALLFASLCSLFAVFVVFVALCISCLYSVRMFNFRLKDVKVVKNASIAGTSVICAALLPLAVHFSSYVVIALIAYFVFLKVFINTVLFDVRDVEGDSLAGTATIPVSLGRQKTKSLLLTLNSTLIPWAAFSAFQGLFHKYIVILVASIVYGYWYILRLCRDGAKVKKTVDLLVDGEWIVIAILVGIILSGPALWSSLLFL